MASSIIIENSWESREKMRKSSQRWFALLAFSSSFFFVAVVLEKKVALLLSRKTSWCLIFVTGNGLRKEYRRCFVCWWREKESVLCLQRTYEETFVLYQEEFFVLSYLWCFVMLVRIEADHVNHLFLAWCSDARWWWWSWWYSHYRYQVPGTSRYCNSTFFVTRLLYRTVLLTNVFLRFVVDDASGCCCEGKRRKKGGRKSRKKFCSCVQQNLWAGVQPKKLHHGSWKKKDFLWWDENSKEWEKGVALYGFSVQGYKQKWDDFHLRVPIPLPKV